VREYVETVLGKNGGDLREVARMARPGTPVLIF